MKSRLKNDSLWHGLALAIINDGKVDDREIALLYDLLCQYKDVKSTALIDLKRLIEKIEEDGIVTPEEEKMLFRFLKDFVRTKTPAEKGAAFEEYVITCFDNKQYRLIEWRSDKYIHGWGGPISCQWPDLVMEYIPTKERFAVECKYRSRPFEGQVTWARPTQIDNYKYYEKTEKIPVYVAIGLGGPPDSPKSFYMAKLRQMKKPSMTLQELERFKQGKDVVLDLYS